MQDNTKRPFLVTCYDYTEKVVRQILNAVDNDQRFIFSLIGLIPFITPLTFALGRNVKLTFWSAAALIANAIFGFLSIVIPFFGMGFFFLSSLLSTICVGFWLYAIFFIVNEIIPDIRNVDKEKDKALLNNREWEGYHIPRNW